VVIQRKGDNNRRVRVVDRSAQPWEEPSEYHTGNLCSKPETDYMRELKAEVERRRRAGLLPTQGRPVEYPMVKDGTCAGCSAPAIEGRILCESCQASTKAKGQTLPFICLVPGCDRHRAGWSRGGKRVLRPYCPQHWRIYQGRSQRARMKRRKDF
jgi:hypothetical protein